MEPNLHMSDNISFLLYVDDIILLCGVVGGLNSMGRKLKGKYPMTDLSPVKGFLGLNVETHGTGHAFICRHHAKRKTA